jgi:hypothetical protein
VPAFKEPSFIDRLTAQYGTSDLVAIMLKEEGARNHTNALRVYDSLSIAQKHGKQAVICRIRALEGLGDKQNLLSFADQNPIGDAEFYIIKARALYGQHRFAEAIVQLDNCQRSQPEFADPVNVQREAVYYRALCLTGMFDANPVDQNRAAAQKAWGDVKYAFSNNRNHPYLTNANEQIRRLNRNQKDDNW